MSLKEQVEYWEKHGWIADAFSDKDAAVLMRRKSGAGVGMSPDGDVTVTLPLPDPTKPYHRWPSNEDVDRPPSLDRCLACGVHRFSNDLLVAQKAAGPCPEKRPS